MAATATKSKPATAAPATPTWSAARKAALAKLKATNEGTDLEAASAAYATAKAALESDPYYKKILALAEAERNLDYLRTETYRQQMQFEDEIKRNAPAALTKLLEEIEVKLAKLCKFDASDAPIRAMGGRAVSEYAASENARAKELRTFRDKLNALALADVPDSELLAALDAIATALSYV